MSKSMAYGLQRRSRDHSMRALILLPLCLAISSAGAVTEQRVEESFDVGKGAKLLVDVEMGAIDVSHGDDSKITVSAYRKIEADNEAQEKEYLASAPIEVIRQGDTVIVRARHAHHGSSWRWSGRITADARYVIRTPKELSAELRTGGGSISASEIAGSFKADTAGGNLKFSRLRGPLEANSGGGQIVLDACDGAISVATSGGKIDASAGSGTLSASSCGGSIAVKNFSGDAAVETNGGSINLDNIRGKLVGETSGGSISATVPAPFPADVKLQTSAGRIEVTLPADAAADLNAETSEGGVTSELPVAAKQAGRNGLQGTINGGGKMLTLRTGAGNIVIRSASPTR
jgi:putative adhesin